MGWMKWIEMLVVAPEKDSWWQDARCWARIALSGVLGGLGGVLGAWIFMPIVGEPFFLREALLGIVGGTVLGICLSFALFDIAIGKRLSRDLRTNILSFSVIFSVLTFGFSSYSVLVHLWK